MIQLEKKEVFTPKAPVNSGPYSQAVVVGPFIYLSGPAGKNDDWLRIVRDKGRSRRCSGDSWFSIEIINGSVLACHFKIRSFL